MTGPTEAVWAAVEVGLVVFGRLLGPVVCAVVGAAGGIWVAAAGWSGKRTRGETALFVASMVSAAVLAGADLLLPGWPAAALYAGPSLASQLVAGGLRGFCLAYAAAGTIGGLVVVFRFRGDVGRGASCSRQGRT